LGEERSDPDDDDDSDDISRGEGADFNVKLNDEY